MPGNEQYPGAKRRPGSKKGPTKGSGGQRRKGLEGKGPTPRAENRVGHPKARAKARAAKDWPRADALRDKLTQAGVVVEDSPSGARWHLA